MASKTAWMLAALLLAPATGRASDRCERDQPPQQQQQQRGSQPGQPGDKGSEHRTLTKWWIDAQSRADLGITDAQSALVEDVWQKSSPKLREGRMQLDKLEDALSQMIRDDAPEVTVIAQIERVENMRADLSKARALMIYRMNKVLTPEQRAKVKARMEKRDGRDGGRREPSHR
jgi:Spy/CpxP family protein refolding chaperone